MCLAGYTDMNLTKHTDMATVVHAMAQRDSGLEVRDRMWLKITIPQAFIGLSLPYCVTLSDYHMHFLYNLQMKFL